MEGTRLILLGKIVGVHGVRGLVKAKMFTASPWVLATGSILHIDVPGQSPRPIAVEHAQPYRRIVRVKFEGIKDRTCAEALVGADIKVPRKQLPPTDEDEYYWFELIGLKVSDKQGRRLGIVTEIIATGANDVYVVRHDTGETLIPAIRSVIRQVDLKSGCMTVELPQGL